MIYVAGENAVSLPNGSQSVNKELQPESAVSTKVKNLTELTTASSSENINDLQLNSTQSTNISKYNVPVITNTKLASIQILHKPGTSTVITPVNKVGQKNSYFILLLK